MKQLLKIAGLIGVTFGVVAVASAQSTFHKLSQLQWSFQQEKSASDSSIVFHSPNSNILKPSPAAELDNAYGMDILLSNSGLGLGAFYRHQYTEEIYGTLALSVSEAKDDNEVEYVDYYGQTYTPGKINRFLLIPLHVGVQYRLFADEIVDNFRPYVNAGVGPTLVFSTPYDKEFFSSLGYGQAHYTLGGYIGLGAFFGIAKDNLSGVNIRYYFIQIPHGLPSMQDQNTGAIYAKKDFGGFFITLNFGALY
ncbi:MAG: hypothetical protein KGJ59_09345 [Bacteroidota bacterium]|nr:hypothetical protein [Bacteroidota bacterium]